VGGAITTNLLRTSLAGFFRTGSGLAKITKIAFGDGGFADGKVVAGDAAQTSLNNELLRKTITAVNEDDYSVTGIGILQKSELVGVAISEAGLFDDAGNLLGLKTFSPKIKDDDETYEVRIKLKF
jgi:phage-related tail fiber protein